MSSIEKAMEKLGLHEKHTKDNAEKKVTANAGIVQEQPASEDGKKEVRQSNINHPNEADNSTNKSEINVTQPANAEESNVVIDESSLANENEKVSTDHEDSKPNSSDTGSSSTRASNNTVASIDNVASNNKAEQDKYEFDVQEQASISLVTDKLSDSQQSEAAKSSVVKKKSNYYEINLDVLSKNGFVTLDSHDRMLREQFRAIKRKVLANAFGSLATTLDYSNLVIVTSCNPHEGKTFSAVNLALNIALEQDKTVLLVDADIVRPSVAGRLGMRNGQGLTEFLAGQVTDISDVIFNTNIDNFKFVPAGKPHELSTELLASTRMQTLSRELSTRYSDRIVIFDSPPLLGVNETHVLANLVGQALVVVAESQTKITDIKSAVGQLNQDIAIGFVLNKSDRSWHKEYGYGGYGGYGSYGHYKSD